MRPGQNNKRMRGRPNNNSGGRKGPNPLTRSYESSGPDVKIRGTAHHIGEKYLQLARDAQSSGDPVMAESYLQHAEHYFRLIAAAQQVQQQSQGTYQRQPGEVQIEETEDDGDFGGIPDRFASPVERLAPPPPQPGLQPQPQPSHAQPGPERPYYNAERQGFDQTERGPRPERTFQDRSFRDNQNQEKPYQERPYQDRNGRPRDSDGRSHRPSRGPRDFSNETTIRVDQRGEAQPAEPEAVSNGLPAFITAPVRVPAEVHDAGPQTEPLTSLLADPAEAEHAGNGFHPRPRRRRRGKAEMATARLAGSDELGPDDSIQE